MAPSGDSDPTITKRLHLALQPQPPHKSASTLAITPAEIRARLSTFPGVSVTSVDGFDLRNALGDLRGWGYVTVEGTGKGVGKCITTLSGTTWKGAKLRIGDARPDWEARLAAERPAPLPQRSKHKYHAGVNASDMSLVTRAGAASRGGGWKVTPLGRVLWAVKMRPDRPLPLPEQSVLLAGTKGKGQGKDVAGKKRKRVREPDVRARRRKIDMTRWGSTYLSGVWLDGGVGGSIQAPDGAGDGDGGENDGGGDREDDAMEGSEGDGDDVAMVEDVPPAQLSATTLLSAHSKVVPPLQVQSAADGTDIATEKMATLNFLASLFGNKDEGGDDVEDDDWVGRESIGSDVDEEALLRGEDARMAGEDTADFEEVPMKRETKMATSSAKPPPPSPKPTAGDKPTGLKDIFAPREDDAGFSLLDHLDLDLELDDEVPFPTTVAPNDPAPPLSSKPIPTSAPATATSTFNPKQTLFFPAASKPKGLKDIFDVGRDRKWSWRDPGVGFFRTETEAEIRARWEEEKGELTRGWRKRWREAGKVRRRKGSGKEVDDE